MMVEIEHTPNPDTLKFLPGKKVSEVGPIEFLKNDKSIKVSLANKILSRRRFYYRKERKRFELGGYEARHHFRN